MDKTSTHDRAARARMLLEDELFMGAVKGIERRAIDALMSAGDADENQLRYCAAQVRVARELVDAIKAEMLNGHDDALRDARAKTIV
jgi:hypothetical protein